IGDGFIITVRHGEAALHDVRLRTEARSDLLECGPGAALYAIVDWIVDNYQPVVAALDRDVEMVEAEVFSPSPVNTAERIFDLKREVLALHAAVAPLDEPLASASPADATDSSTRRSRRIFGTSTTTCCASSTRSRIAATS